MQNFKHPELGEIRVLGIDGAPWFVGKDIATALGYGNPRDALANHVDKEEKAVSPIPTSSGTQKMTVINEDGLLRLIFSSRCPHAKAIKNWIYHDVLPVLREHNNSNPNDDNTLELCVNTSNTEENCSHMTEFIPIEREGVRVLLTSQLAEAYETTEQVITNNFNRNKERYAMGKHYFLLEGDALKEFKATTNQIELSSIRINKLYLWTEKGALLHAKSLNTDKAWEVYDYLVETYFRMRETSRCDTDVFSRSQFDINALSPSLQMAKMLSESLNTLSISVNALFEAMARTELEQKRQEKALETVDRKVEDIREIVVIHPDSWREECRRLVAAIARKRGGNSEAYSTTNIEIFDLVDRRGKVSLQTRLTNRRKRMAEEGISKSQQNKLNKVDIIAEDAKLTEIYIAVIKEKCIQYGVSVDIVDVAK